MRLTFVDSTKYPKLTYLVHKSANENPNKKNGIGRLIVRHEKYFL